MKKRKTAAWAATSSSVNKHIRRIKMYKGFFKDVEYVMGLFLKPFEGCCEKDDKEEEA